MWNWASCWGISHPSGNGVDSNWLNTKLPSLENPEVRINYSRSIERLSPLTIWKYYYVVHLALKRNQKLNSKVGGGLVVRYGVSQGTNPWFCDSCFQCWPLCSLTGLKLENKSLGAQLHDKHVLDYHMDGVPVSWQEEGKVETMPGMNPVH